MTQRISRRRPMASAAVLAAAMTAAHPAAAEEPRRLDEVSVTATRAARATKDVPQSISVVGAERIDQEKMTNLKDALQGIPGVMADSKNGGADTRLIIRGSGVKAAYGVREVMVLRDGVPVTDPDSFTRLDFIDTQDIEQVEVVKGPGSPFAAGSAGGTIQIMSKSVFSDDANRARIGFGNQGAENYHLRYGGMISDNQAVAITASRRAMNNDWRKWNNFETNQIGIKHGLMDSDGGTLESEISFSNSFSQLPGTMNQAQFDEYRRTGKQTAISDAFEHSNRDTWSAFANTRYEKTVGDFTFRPRAYYTHWEHFHPVTGAINVSENNHIFGGDLDGELAHKLGAMPSTLVGGVSLRADLSLDARKYAYRDVQTSGGKITKVLTDIPGQLIEISDTRNTMAGVFLQETVTPVPDLSIDVAARLDRSMFDIQTNEMKKYDYNATVKNYVTGAGVTQQTPSYTLFSPKAGLSYKLTSTLTGYVSTARADQVPSSSEIATNPGLKPADSTNYEVGLKMRARDVSFDLAAYYNPVKDDIVQVRENGQSVYQNAGQTQRNGFEASVNYAPVEGLTVGGSYAYSDYVYDKFYEVTRVGGSSVTTSRAGRRVPLVPEHQYSLWAEAKHAHTGLKARLQGNSWDQYYMDNANTQKYGGAFFVTSLMLGWDITPQHGLALNVDNLFDQHYAVEAKKDTSGNVTYSAAAPRTVLASYTMKF